MTDQIPADLADKVRKLAARFRQQMEPHTPAAECAVWECAAEAVEALLPPRPTLADMTPEERAACKWMQADAEDHSTRYVIVTPFDNEAETGLISADGGIFWAPSDRVTPRPDLPRMEWPGTEKPAPALPDGWRLADHKKHGRVIVTNTTPNRAGNVCFAIPSVGGDALGFEWHTCGPAELTYLDQEDDTSTGPDHLAVGTVIESADDPRIAALPDGSVLRDCDGDTTTKHRRVWTGAGYAPIPSEDGYERGPWTVLHIPKETDQ